MRKTSAFIALFIVVSGCAGSARVSTSAEVDVENDASTPEEVAAVDAGIERDADSAPEDAGPEESPVAAIDPEAVETVVQKAEQAGIDGALGLRFEVSEQGPSQPWVFAVVNRGTEPVSVVFDSRLLTLEIEPPPPPEPETTGKKKPVRKPKPPKPTLCKLPADIVPNSPEKQLVEELEPGEGLVQAFDPRLYCVPSDIKPMLLAGARVTARFGWPEKTKTVWRAGGKVKVPVEQSPPFVASPPTDGSSEATAENAESDAGASVERRVKQLQASPITLGEAYALPVRKPADVDQPLVLSVLRGSDARNEASATITVAIKNRSKSRKRVFFRREFLTFEVAGPEGFVGCDPTPDDRAPDRAAFTMLRPGGQVRSVSRLTELCPANTFARPGLYLIHARVDFPESGARHDLEAFTGTVMSTTPAAIRIRKGDMPYVPPGGVVRVRVGG